MAAVPGTWANGGDARPHPGRAQGMVTMPVGQPPEEPPRERKPPGPRPGCEDCTEVACERHSGNATAGLPDLGPGRERGHWSADVYGPCGIEVL